MSQPILRYPDGVMGFALVLMRLSIGFMAIFSVNRLWPTPSIGWLPVIPSLLLTIALVAGAGTRSAALILASMMVADLIMSPDNDALLLIGSAGSAAALSLMGPGAFSIDAHRFGRRVIRLEPRSPDRGINT